jgi:hypothetical protein
LVSWFLLGVMAYDLEPSCAPRTYILEYRSETRSSFLRIRGDSNPGILDGERHARPSLKAQTAALTCHPSRLGSYITVPHTLTPYISMPVRIISSSVGIRAFFSGESPNITASKEEAASRDAAKLAKRTQAAFDRWLATQKPEANKELPPFIIVHIIRHGFVKTFFLVNFSGSERHLLTT